MKTVKTHESFFCKYKMYIFSIKKWGRNGVEAIVYDNTKWINQTQLGKRLEHTNIASFTHYYSEEDKTQKCEVQDCNNYQTCRAVLEEEVGISIMINTKTQTADEYRAKFGFNEDIQY